MNDDLVKRLRRASYSAYACQGCDDSEREEAADRIEQLQAALREIANPANWEGMDWVSHGVPKWIARAALEGDK
jgi:hypothetical protein